MGATNFQLLNTAVQYLTAEYAVIVGEIVGIRRWAVVTIGFIVFGDIPDGWTWLGAAIIVASGFYIMRRETIRGREARQADDDKG